MEKPGYKITVSGQYYAGVGKDKQIKTFANEVFYIPLTVKVQNGRKFVEQIVAGKKTRVSVPIVQEVNGLRAAQHVIQRRFLAARLSEKYTDFSNIRLCQIVDQQNAMVPADQLIDVREKPIKSLTLGELKTLCSMESLSTQPGAFANLDDARAAVAAELRTAGGASLPKAVAAPVEAEDDGIRRSEGAVTSDDGVPIDEEDPAASLM